MESRGAADQKRSLRWGWFVGWGEKEGQAVIDCTARVVTMRRRRMASGCGENGGLGFAPRAAVKAWCPSPENTPTSLQWAVPWSHWIFDWHTPPIISANALSNPSPQTPRQKHNNVPRADWNSTAKPWRHRQRQQWQKGGGGSCGSLGSYKKQMLNHLSTPKLVVQKNLVGQEKPLRPGGVTLECIVRCRRLLMRSATHHSRLNGQQQSRDSLSGEHFLAFLQCKKSQWNKDASISKISTETRGQVWELCGFKASVLKDSPTSPYLNSQNQFIENEGTSGRWRTCVHLIFYRTGFAEGFIATSDLISFSYASKSQVRQTIGMIQGE